MVRVKDLTTAQPQPAPEAQAKPASALDYSDILSDIAALKTPDQIKQENVEAKRNLALALLNNAQEAIIEAAKRGVDVVRIARKINASQAKFGKNKVSIYKETVQALIDGKSVEQALDAGNAAEQSRVAVRVAARKANASA